ncbi:MAG: starvation-sensing protein RspA [Bacteroidetes bacterium]|nr:starvation-sensing protein RspA [Bacteroidota bacterium]MDA1119971.1 starvation-sensing protein RspA [Bacteroidota bacterium]
MNRRNILQTLGLGTLGLPFMAGEAGAKEMPTFTPPRNFSDDDVKITKVKAVATSPHGIELIMVKIETNQPGLYGYGCATFRQRAHAVIVAIDEYLDDFCRGKSVNNIEDIWQTAYVSSYWRNGPVLNNALSGLDQALWDIKGKMAGMPVYELLGGKCRFAVDTYTHASGPTPEAVLESAQGFRERGWRHIRIQLGGYGSTHLTQDPDYKKAGFGMPDDNTVSAMTYMKGVLDIFELVRKEMGADVQLLHDVHERLQPMDVINMIKELEQYRPFFIEDPFSPENMNWFKYLRQQTSCPIAMGELFNNSNEWLNPMAERLFDFIRIHISQIGGITPAMKVARLGEWFNVRTAWHGPGDVSPVGHAANAHIDLAIWNFGIQEAVNFSPLMYDIFPGAPTMDKGYMMINEAPGLGVDMDEALAKKYPLPKFNYNWTQLRNNDGTPVRP